MSDTEAEQLLRAKLLGETAQIPWAELLRFFAQGRAIWVADNLDLIEVAEAFSKDNRRSVEQWLAAGEVAPVSDEKAQGWLNREQLVWSVVVRPWVLVQVRGLQS